MTQIKVTTWANGDRDFASGRWVQLGPPTRLNFWLTGLPGGKIYLQSSFPWIRYECCDVEFDQHTTMYIDPERLRKPVGLVLMVGSNLCLVNASSCDDTTLKKETPNVLS